MFQIDGMVDVTLEGEDKWLIFFKVIKEIVVCIRY